MQFWSHEREAMMVLWDVSLAYGIADRYFTERWQHLLKNIKLGEFLLHYY